MSAITPTKAEPANADEGALFYESATAEVLARRTWAEQAVVKVLTAMIVTCIVVISVVKVDRIVTTTGHIVPLNGTITVQPLEKAIISRILVSVGEHVKKGQVLATLDPTFVKASLAQLQQQVASLDAQRRRLEAEESTLPFRADPSKPSDLLEASIWRQRTTEFRSGVEDFDQRINSSREQIAGLRRSIADLREQVKIASRTAYMYAEMERIGAGSQLQSITVEGQKLEQERKLSDEEKNLASTLHSEASLREQRKIYIDQRHRDNLTALVGVKVQLAQAESDLTKATKLGELSSLVSPVDGIVVTVPSLSAGGVVMEAEPMFGLVAVDDPLEVDVQIDSIDSGFVRTGDLARIKFDAYKFLEHGMAEGRVKTISEESFTQASGQDLVTTAAGASAPEKRTPYFAARISITAVKLHDVPPDFRLVPGMTLQADIVVGRRTIMWYLLGGAFKSGAEAMHEP